MADSTVDPSLRRLLERFGLNPTDVRAFRSLEEALFLSGAWSQLVNVYSSRIAALERGSTEWADLVLRLAKTYEERLGDLAAAERRYVELLRRVPGHAEALACLRRIHTRQGALSAALQIAEVEEGLDLPSEQRARTLGEIGELWCEVGEISEAEGRFREALSLDPSCDAALRGAASLAERRGDRSVALELEERRLEQLRGAARAEALEHMASLLPEDGEDRARALLREALRESPERRSAHDRLLALERRRGAWGRVDELYRARLTALLEPREQLTLALEGATVLLEEAEDPERALFFILRAQEVADDDPRVHHLRARALRRLGRTAELILALERLVALEGSSAMLTLELAALHEREGQPERAVQSLEQHLRAEPGDREALQILDRCLEHLGRHDERVAILAQRAELAREPRERLEHMLALAELQGGPAEDPDAAEATYRKVLEEDPENTLASDRLEQLLRKQQRTGDLVAFLQQSAAKLTDGESAARAWCSLAETQLQGRGDHAAARDAFLRALTADPRHEAALAGLHRVARAAADPTWKIEACERELDLEPSAERRAALLESLVTAARSLDDPERALRYAEAWAEESATPSPLRVLAELAHESADATAERAALERLEPLLEGSPVERAAVLGRLGALALEQEDPHALQTALQWYRTAVEVHPDPELRAQLIRLYRQSGDLPSVVFELRAALQATPPDEQPAARMELARTLAELGDLARATYELEAVLELAPGWREAEHLLEGLLEEQDRFEDLARQMARRLARETDPDARCELGFRLAEVYLEQLSRPEEAAAVLRELADPTRFERLEALFERALEASQATGELESWLRLREVHVEGGEHTNLLLRLSRLQEELGHLQDAANTLRRAEEQAPRERRDGVRALLTRLLRKLGDPEQQLEVLARSIDDIEDPREHWVLRVERAQILAESLGRHEQAIGELERAQEVSPLDARALRLLVSLYRRTGVTSRRAKALELLAAATDDRDERVRALVELSDLLLAAPGDTRDLAAAERALNRLRDLNPEHPEPFERLCRLYESQDRPRDLERLLSSRLEEVELAPAERTALCLRLGRLRVALGELAMAAELLREARADGASNAATNELLLHCLQQLGDLDGQIALAAERAESEVGSARAVWLERWLEALRASGASAEQCLAVVEGLAQGGQLDSELVEVRLGLLRQVDRPAELANALDAALPLLEPHDPRRRVRTRELLALYEGVLGAPGRALDLLERELPSDETLRPIALRLVEEVEDPEREVALLEPLVATGSRDLPPAWLRRLGLALTRLGRGAEGAPLLWQTIENHPRDLAALEALVEVLRRGEDASQLGRALELLFPLVPEDSQLEIVREGFAAAERAGEDVAALRWLRRMHVLEALSRTLAERWATLERAHGDTGQRLTSLEALAASAAHPEERAPVLAEQGALQHERGDLEAARLAYGAAIESASSPQADWLEALDEILARLGRAADRLDVLAALARHPERSAEERAHVQQTYVELLVAQPGTRSDAARELQLFVESDPVADRRVHVERLRTLLRVYEELEEPAEWCDRAEELLPLLPASERRPLERRLAQRLGGSLGARRRAVAAWRRVLEHAPDDLEALDALIALHRVPGQEALLAETLERRAALEQGGPERRAALLVDAASVHWRELGSAGRAIRDLDQALELQPELLAGHALRAELAAHLGRPQEEASSLRVLLGATEPSPADAERWARLAVLLSRQRDTTEEAARAAERALELTTERSAVVPIARQVFERAGRWEDAALALREEIDGCAEEDRPALLARLASLSFEQLDRPEDACAALAALAERGALSSDQDELWADALGACGDWPAALARRRTGLEKLGARAGAARWLELSHQILERLGDAEAARRACDAALECEPASKEALAARLELHERLGDDSRELEDAARLADLLPAGPESAAAFARAAQISQRRLGDSARAWVLYQAALESHSNDVEALIGAGEIALEREEWREAERSLARACSLLEGTPARKRLAHAARLAAEAAWQGARRGEAFRLLEVSLREEPDHADALDRMADVSLALAAHGSACQALEARLRLGDLEGSERARRLLLLARAHEARDQLDEAARALEAAIEVLPDDEAAREQLVRLLEPEAPERALEQLLAWEGRAPLARQPGVALHAARLEARLGRRTDARRRLQALADAGRLGEEGWRELAGWLLEDGASEAALEVAARGLERVEQRYSRGILLWIQAQALDRLGRRSEAANRASEALECTPGNLEAASLLADQLGQVEDWQVAVERLERAIDQGRPDPTLESELWNAIGRACAGPLEDIAAAQQAFRRALERNPLLDSAREALADITAFDPGGHAESLRLHDKLLVDYPARPGSWRALHTIAKQRQEPAALATCREVLDALGLRGDGDERDGRERPVIHGEAPASRELAAATEFLLALDSLEALPERQAETAADGLPAGIQAELTQLAGRAWQLDDEVLRALLGQAGREADPRLEALPRKARRRLKRALRSVDPLAIQRVDPTIWRSELLAYAAAAAVGNGRVSLQDAVRGLLLAWPRTAHLDVGSPGRVLSPLTQDCPPARLLLLRAARGCMAALG